MSDREAYVSFLLTLTGQPYIYGGTRIDGVDCSGCVYLAMAHTSCPLKKRMNSLQLSRHFANKKINPLQAPPGSLFFYGSPVNHVMSVITHFNGGGIVLLGARGGDSTTTTPEKAVQKGAYVATTIASTYWKSKFNFAVDPFQT